MLISASDRDGTLVRQSACEAVNDTIFLFLLFLFYFLFCYRVLDIHRASWFAVFDYDAMFYPLDISIDFIVLLETTVREIFFRFYGFLLLFFFVMCVRTN